MTFSARIARFYWQSVFRLSERRTLSGCQVGVFLPQTEARPVIEQKCAQALELLHAYSPRHLERVRTYAEGLLVFGESGIKQGWIGRWLAPSRLIQLNQAWMLRRETDAVDVAVTIVHEATHAWLEHHGFKFVVDCRQRIEAICYRSEAAFARRIPNGEETAELYERCASLVLNEAEKNWSDNAFRQRDIRELRALGAPEWLVDGVQRIATMLPNER